MATYVGEQSRIRHAVINLEHTTHKLFTAMIREDGNTDRMSREAFFCAVSCMKEANEMFTVCQQWPSTVDTTAKKDLKGRLNTLIAEFDAIVVEMKSEPEEEEETE